MSNSGDLLIVSAPSGSGKTSVATSTLAQVERLCFSVSYTTRSPRRGEREGTDYRFVSTDQFTAMRSRGQLLEWAQVYGHYYGTDLEFVQRQRERGWDVLLDIDVQGARTVKETLPESHLVFLFPPSFEALEQRLRSRGLDDEKVIRSRLELARTEILAYREYDYLILNEDIELAVSELKSIICAARCRRTRRHGLAEKILASFPEAVAKREDAGQEG